MKKLFLLLLIFFTSCTANYYFNNALESEMLGNMVEAERLYFKSCNMGSIDACNNLGVVYLKRGDTGNALDFFRRACNGNRFAIGCQNLAKLYKEYGVGNYDEAKSAADFACKYRFDVACNIFSSKKANKRFYSIRANKQEFLDDALKGAMEYNNLSK